MNENLKVGKVVQTFGDGSQSKVYILKELPNVDQGYWSCRVNLFNEDGSWNHTAHVDSLKNVS